MLLTLLIKGITFLKFEDALQEQSIAYTEIETKPAPLQAILWSANVETKDAFLIGYYSLFDSQPITFGTHPKNHELLGDLAKNDKIKRLIKLTNGFYTITQTDGKLYLNDLRFGTLSVNPNNQQYVFSFLIEENKDDVTITENRKRPEDAKKILVELWNRVWGN